MLHIYNNRITLYIPARGNDNKLNMNNFRSSLNQFSIFSNLINLIQSYRFAHQQQLRNPEKYYQHTLYLTIHIISSTYRSRSYPPFISASLLIIQIVCRPILRQQQRAIRPLAQGQGANVHQECATHHCVHRRRLQLLGNALRLRGDGGQQELGDHHRFVASADAGDIPE